MTPLEVFRTYVAVKLHFSDPGYDYVVKKEAVRVTQASLDKRRDKAFFDNVARSLPEKPQVLQFFIANFVDSPDAWIGDLVMGGGYDVYDGWKRRISNIGSEMSYDLNNMRDLLAKENLTWEQALSPARGYPIPFKLYRKKMICPETFVLIDRLSGFCDKMTQSGMTDLIWRDTTFRMHKYSRFLVTITTERYGHLLPEIKSDYGVNPHHANQGAINGYTSRTAQEGRGC